MTGHSPEPAGVALAARQWWLVFLVPFGFMAWAAFLYAGLRVGRWLWVAWAVLYLAFAYVLADAYGDHDAVDPNPTFENVTLISMLILWVVSACHGMYIRREFLERVRLSELGSDVLMRRQVAIDMAREKPRLARAIGIGRPDRFGARHSGLVDLNSAPAEVLTRLPGIDDALAAQIVDLRPYTSVEELGATFDLPAQDVENLRDMAVFIRPR